MVFELKNFDKIRNQIGTLLFWVCVTIELFRACFCFAFSIPDWYEVILKIMVVLLLLKIFLTNYTRKEWIVIGIVILWGLLAHRVSGDWSICRVLMLVAASKDINRKAILKYCFWSIIASVVLIFLSGLFEIGGNYLSLTLDFGRSVGIEKRYTFGYGHPNAFSLISTSLMMLGLYIYWNKVKWYHLLILGMIEQVVLATVASRTGYAVSMAVLAMACILKYVPRKYLRNIPVILGEMYVLGSVTLSIMAVYCGEKWYRGIYGKINAVFNQRPLAAAIVSGVNTVSPLGTSNQKYTDMGLVSLFYKQGYLFAACYIILVCYLLWKLYNIKDNMGFILVLGWAMINTFEAYSVPYVLHNHTWLILLGYWPVLFRKNVSTLSESRVTSFLNKEVFAWRFFSVSSKS